MSLGTSQELAFEWVLDKIAKASSRPRAGKVRILSAEEKKKDLAGRKITEVELWHQWKKTRKKEDLTPLIKSFSGMIQSRVNVYRGSEVPSSSIEYQQKKALVKAFETWDPSKGTQLQTWVWQHLKRTQRYVDERKNFLGRIPENISKNIGPFNALKAELTERLGHEPDAHTIHDHILKHGHERLEKLSIKEIQRLNREQRKSHIQQGFDVDYALHEDLDPRDEEVKHLILYELTPQERIVHEYTFGLNGKPRLSPGQISKTTGFDPSKVSKLRTSIHNKMLPYLNR